MTEITLDYTDCDQLSSQSSNTSATFTDLSSFTYRLRASEAHLSVNPPQWAFVNGSGESTCLVRFHVPADLPNTVFLYFKLTNFFQNHRRYVKSQNTDQLKGQFVSPDSLNKGDCKPLATSNGKAIWPCGLIANSLFNGMPFIAVLVCHL